MRFVATKPPTGHPDLIVATVTLAIYCGDDTSLYIFQQRDQNWRLVIMEEANDYETVAGGQGRFKYAISPQKDNFFVVTANVTSWCTSFWQSIRYCVLRPGSSVYGQALLQSQDIIYLGNEDPPYKLTVTANSFRLQYEGEDSNPELLIRNYNLHYQVNNKGVYLLPDSKY